MVSYKDRFTKEKITEIIEAYNAEKNISLVSKAYEISPSTLRKILDENGVQRNKRTYKTNHRICPNCGERATTGEAKYCCLCGSDLRTQKEIDIIEFEHLIDTCGDNFIIQAWAKIKSKYISEV